MSNEEILENKLKLNFKQKKAFERLKKCYLTCKDLGIEFYKSGNTLGALNKKEKVLYNDNRNDGIKDRFQNCENEFEFNIPDWTDDEHYFHVKPEDYNV